ncbi:MAG: D-alanyl-D-alanine carboxypeptidase family protein [Myxococcales bacterium]|nr:D-alanyl-D-alanine carboxypeptidase family protein [Myxococcales bacterium]
MTRVSAAQRIKVARASGNPVASHSLLRVGSSGAEVAQLQRMLRSAGFDPGSASGTFDQRTLKAVRAFQSARGLQVDGLVGQQTWGAFYGKSYPPGTSMLRGGAPAQSTGASPVQFNRDTFEGSVGPGKRVQAYVNGRPTTITVASVGNGEYMRTDAAKAFLAMQQAARRAGISLPALSGFRTMAEQQTLYQKYLNGTGNLAARPGYSNHQNGISMDIGNVGGYGTATYRWLQQNASRFGFANDVRGEYWHWTFRG